MTLMLIAARALSVASARLLHVGKLGLRQQQPESNLSLCQLRLRLGVRPRDLLTVLRLRSL